MALHGCNSYYVHSLIYQALNASLCNLDCPYFYSIIRRQVYIYGFWIHTTSSFPLPESQWQLHKKKKQRNLWPLGLMSCINWEEFYPASPAASPKHLTKLSIFFRKASSVEVKISTDGKSPTSLCKLLLNWTSSLQFCTWYFSMNSSNLFFLTKVHKCQWIQSQRWWKLV